MDTNNNGGVGMKKVQRKLRSKKGETLVEVIAAILICVLSVSLLMGGVAASAAINKSAESTDQMFYETLSQAETKQTPLSIEDAKVVIEEDLMETEVPIKLYGGEGMYSYGISKE